MEDLSWQALFAVATGTGTDAATAVDYFIAGAAAASIAAGTGISAAAAADRKAATTEVGIYKRKQENKNSTKKTIKNTRKQ